jgi:4,5-dihydroxyphthalate decarboxylase
MFVHASAGINSPGDLRGKRVAVWSFQTTLSVLAKGDLKFEYGVPWETIRWLSIYPEEMPIKIEGVSVEQIPSGKDAAQLFLAGEIDAMIHPHPPSEILSATNKVRRLFKDWRSEAVRYFRKYGHYPIMHLLAMPNDLADREPWLPRALIEWWEEAKTMAAGFYHDPSYALMPFAHCEIDTQNKLLGRDPWTSGLAANRKDLEKFLAYSFDQRLTEEPLAVEDLFHRSVLDT